MQIDIHFIFRRMRHPRRMCDLVAQGIVAVDGLQELLQAPLGILLAKQCGLNE